MAKNTMIVEGRRKDADRRSAEIEVATIEVLPTDSTGLALYGTIGILSSVSRSDGSWRRKGEMFSLRQE